MDLSPWHFWLERWSKYTVQAEVAHFTSHPPLWKHSSNILTENICCPINFVWKLGWLTVTIPVTNRNGWAYFKAQSLLQLSSSAIEGTPFWCSKTHFLSPIHPCILGCTSHNQVGRSGIMNRCIITETSILCLDYYFNLSPKDHWNKIQRHVWLVTKCHSWIHFCDTAIKGKNEWVTILTKNKSESEEKWNKLVAGSRTLSCSLICRIWAWSWLRCTNTSLTN